MTDQEKKDRWDDAEADWQLAQQKLRAFFIDPKGEDEDYAQTFIEQVQNLYRSHVVRAMFPRASRLAEAIIQMRTINPKCAITAPAVRQAFGQKLKLSQLLRPSISKEKPVQ